VLDLLSDGARFSAPARPRAADNRQPRQGERTAIHRASRPHAHHTSGNTTARQQLGHGKDRRRRRPTGTRRSRAAGANGTCLWGFRQNLLQTLNERARASVSERVRIALPQEPLRDNCRISRRSGELHPVPERPRTPTAAQPTRTTAASVKTRSSGMGTSVFDVDDSSGLQECRTTAAALHGYHSEPERIR